MLFSAVFGDGAISTVPPPVMALVRNVGSEQTLAGPSVIATFGEASTGPPSRVTDLREGVA
jgi:hypothetical protein